MVAHEAVSDHDDRAGCRVHMSAAAAPAPSLGRAQFVDAAPAHVRAALTPEDVAEFDQQWRAAMAAATETLDLTGVHQTLESWRRVAWLTAAHGPDGYRRLLATAEQRARTGERAPGAVTWSQLQYQ